jgi:hypothetical protein
MVSGLDKGSGGAPAMATLPSDERRDKNDNGKGKDEIQGSFDCAIHDENCERLRSG